MYLQTAHALSATPLRVLTDRPERAYLLAQNRGPGDVYLGLGASHMASVEEGIHLCRGASLELARGQPGMAVYAMTPAAARLVMVEG